LSSAVCRTPLPLSSEGGKGVRQTKSDQGGRKMKKRKKRKSRKKFINAPAWAYLIRVFLTLVLLGISIPDLVFLGVFIPGKAVKIVIYCILDSIVDYKVIKPIVRKSKEYILRKWKKLKDSFSNVHIDIRMDLGIAISFGKR
jgi:hypothetical protein